MTTRYAVLLLISQMMLSVSSDPLIESDMTSDNFACDGGSVTTVGGGSVVAFVSSVDSRFRQFTMLQAYDYYGKRLGDRVIICEHRTPAISPEISGGSETAAFHVVFQFGTELRHVQGELTATGINLLTESCTPGTDFAGPSQHNLRIASSVDGHVSAMVSSSWIGGATDGIKLHIYNGEYYSTASPPVTVSSFGSSIQSNPDVAVLGNHTIVVVWQDLHSERIYEMLYNEDGIPISNIRFPAAGLNQTGFLSAPTVTSFTGKDYAIGWKFTGGDEDLMVEGGRVTYGASYIRVYSDVGDLIPWRASADYGFSGHILSISSSLDNTMWLVYTNNGFINGKNFGQDGAGGHEFQLFAQITTHASNVRISTDILVPFGIVFTFSDGIRGSITTYHWDGYQTTENPLPKTDPSIWQQAYSSYQHNTYSGGN